VRTEPTTRARILRAAERVFAERGYEGARLREIAAAVGIRKASLFHHFAGKEELYQAVLEESVRDVGREIARTLGRPVPHAERLRELVSVYVDLVADRPMHARMLLRQALDEDAPPAAALGSALAPLFAVVVEFVRDGQRAGAFRPVDAPTPLMLTVVGAVTFFFTAVHVVAPAWPAANPTEREFAAAVKRHVTTVVERLLLPSRAEAEEEASSRDAGRPDAVTERRRARRYRGCGAWPESF